MSESGCFIVQLFYFMGFCKDGDHVSFDPEIRACYPHSAKSGTPEFLLEGKRNASIVSITYLIVIFQKTLST